MTDIVERLRSYLKSELDTSDDAARERDNMIEEAADEIERLLALQLDPTSYEASIRQRDDEIERLRSGLRVLATEEYDAGYSPEGYAEAVLWGHEPQGEIK